MIFVLLYGIIVVTTMGVSIKGPILYADDGLYQSQPFPLDRHRMKQFRSHMLSLMGLQKPSENVNDADEFATQYMSMLYRAMGQSSDELHFNPNFKFFTDHHKKPPLFDFGKIQSIMHTSDVIISFVPKSVQHEQNNTLYVLEFQFNNTEFEILRLLSAELHCIFHLNSSKLSQPAEILISDSKDYSGNYFRVYRDISMHDEAYFSLEVSNLLNLWSSSAYLWVKLLSINGDDLTKSLPQISCFGVAFFVEAKQKALQRIRRSFDLEVEENLDDEYSDDKKSTKAIGEYSQNVNGEEENFNVERDNIKNAEDNFAAQIVDSELIEEAIFYDDASWGLILETEMNDEHHKSSINTTSNLLSLNASNSDINETTSTDRELQAISNFTDSDILNNFLSSTSSTTKFHSVLRSISGNRRCRVRSLYVDFKDLGWDSWVIAPAGYQADYCDGDCSFPLDSSVSPTNHAIVQTLMHLFDEKRAVSAKCAPIAMRAQSLLFFNNQKNVVMRRYQNMRVKQCGCR